MTVSDLYKVIDSDTPFSIEYQIGNMYGTVVGDDWDHINQDLLDMRIKNIWMSKFFNRLMITAEDLQANSPKDHYSDIFDRLK